MKLILLTCFLLFQLGSCDRGILKNDLEMEEEVEEHTSSKVSVEEVNYSGTSNMYNLSVTLKSPDTGCEQYADWWEVINKNEELIYRRVLAHSHVTEQPFSRSGGPIMISATDTITIRGHMNVDGYGLLAMTGSIAGGFEKVQLEEGYASSLESMEPQPPNCAF